MRINKKTALSLIEDSKGRYFTISFTKKDGSYRKLTGHVKNSSLLTIDGYLKLRTIITEEFRKIDTRTIDSLTINKTTFKIK